MLNQASGLIEEFKRRTSNPFISSTLLALTTINYKLFLVLISNQNYEEKFKYIEKTLYTSPANVVFQLAIYPLLVAAFFTFLWPLIDTEISACHIKLENRKKLRTILAEQKRPIPQDEQAQFFEHHNTELQELKSKLSVAVERERRITRELNEQISTLQQNARISTFQRLAEHTDLDATEVQAMLNFDGWVIRQNENFVKAVKSIPQAAFFEKIIIEIDKIAIEDEFRKTGTLDWLSSIVKKTNSHALSMHELFFAIGLFGGLKPDGKSFDINHNNYDIKEKIKEIGVIFNSK